ncbi:hypothetical protein [Kingella potus]|uniref:hypothetical protein n=1 Tax=Kingella potus TaxID=265175 RepID=UPI001FCFBB51|nr:hypothetical protein [Kingella potus]UOP00176.1 hypothetical protein LVJ84_09550 [Kingella potus]
MGKTRGSLSPRARQTGSVPQPLQNPDPARHPPSPQAEPSPKAATYHPCSQ